MIKDDYHVIGLMSGTSLDGIDLVYIHFNKATLWNYKILHSATVPYSSQWKARLSQLTAMSSNNLKEIDKEYTEYLADTISNFIKVNDIKDIDLISSHGHTALHQPNNGISYQIGNLPKLSKILRRTVVCDFRIADVLLGGQGAPLVPVGDELLFLDYDFCLNLGGFANISTKHNNERIAYDVCPVNIVLNHYVSKLKLDYDENGKISSTGLLHTELLKDLNMLPYYFKEFPKSLGLEWVQQEIFPLIDSYKLRVQDVLRTFVEHIVMQIQRAVSNKNNSTVLCTGGGTYNSFLVHRLKEKLNAKIILPTNEVIEYKEALIFGLLGVLRLRNEINCFASVTGAAKDHSSGKIFPPEIFA